MNAGDAVRMGFGRIAYDGLTCDKRAAIHSDSRRPIMMSAPFFLLAGGLWAVSAGRRSLALVLWALGAAVMLGLFRLHATDALNIAL